ARLCARVCLAMRYALWDRGVEWTVVIGLSRFSVDGVMPATAAGSASLDAVGRVPLRLRRLIVPPLAVGASEGDRVSYSGCQESSWLRAWKRPEGGTSRPAARVWRRLGREGDPRPESRHEITGVGPTDSRRR